jgi:tRNA(Ile)-lysidine synthase
MKFGSDNLGLVLNKLSSFHLKTQFLIGCSGGMDSMLLLHLMSIFSTRIRAIYIDHQLQGSSPTGAICSKHAEQLNIPVVIQKVEVDQVI